MTRSLVALTIPDLSAFAKNLRAELVKSADLPGHLSLMNMLARASGFGNFQHLKASVSTAGQGAEDKPHSLAAKPNSQRNAKALRCFDGKGRMAVWPAKTTVQEMCLWVLWSTFPARQALTEKQLNARIDAWHTFGDRALLRRSLIDHGLFTRAQDGSSYTRVEREPPLDAIELIRGLAARQ